MDESVQNQNMVHLFQKYIENRCTRQELLTVLNWLKESGDSPEFDFSSQALWKQIDSQASVPDKKEAGRLNREANLLLSRIRQKEGYPIKRNVFPLRKQPLRFAALFLLFLSIGTGYYFTRKPDMVPITYKEISAGRGETKEYTLDDGTHVILNSESKIVIPSDYNENDRSVEMTGEGFFDVVPDPRKPFILKNGIAQVKVLGTSFNVKAYPDDDCVSVSVSEGRVLVTVDNLDLQLRVSPSEHLTINRKTGGLAKSPFEVNHYISWIEGSLFFDKEPIDEVVRTINRRYPTNVILRCGRCDHIISGTSDNKSLEAVVEAICFTTGLKHKKEGENIILYE